MKRKSIQFRKKMSQTLKMRSRIKRLEKKKTKFWHTRAALAYNKKIPLKIKLQKKNKTYKVSLCSTNNKTVSKIYLK